MAAPTLAPAPPVAGPAAELVRLDRDFAIASARSGHPSLFLHPSQEHPVAHTTPIAKHSQYFLRQALRLHRHPALCDRPDASSLLTKASGFLARIDRTVESRSAMCSALLRHSVHWHSCPHSCCAAKQSQYSFRHRLLRQAHRMPGVGGQTLTTGAGGAVTTGVPGAGRFLPAGDALPRFALARSLLADPARPPDPPDCALTGVDTAGDVAETQGADDAPPAPPLELHDGDEEADPEAELAAGAPKLRLGDVKVPRGKVGGTA